MKRRIESTLVISLLFGAADAEGAIASAVIVASAPASLAKKVRVQPGVVLFDGGDRKETKMIRCFMQAER